MVDKSYMLERPPAPSAVKVFLDQRAIPVAIDAAGSVESGLYHTMTTVRQNPLAALGLALGFGWLLAVMLGRRRMA